MSLTCACVFANMQVALAGFMPAITYAAALVFTACAVGITLWHFAASSQQAQPTDRLSIWNMWQLGSGLIGLAVVPQVCLFSTCFYVCFFHVFIPCSIELTNKPMKRVIYYYGAISYV